MFNKMALKYFLSVLLTHNLLMSCASAAVHSHSVDTLERESDGSFRARNADHYGDAGHNSEFDHEAILGTRCFIVIVFMTSLAAGGFTTTALVVDKKC